MDIFKVDEVKKYVELKTESINLEAVKFIREDAKLKALVDEAIKGSIDKVRGSYFELMGERYVELSKVVVYVIKTFPEDERVKFVSEALPLTGQELLKIAEAEEQDELNSTQNQSPAS